MTAGMCVELGCPYAALHNERCAIHGDATADTCSDCGSPTYNAGLCRRHYDRRWRARKKAERETVR